MDQYVTDGKLDSTSKKIALGLSTDDGNGQVEASTTSFMDFGSYGANSAVAGAKGTIQFNSNEYYWTAPLDGIRFGGTVSGSYALNGAEVSIDTGRQCLYVPSENYEFIYNNLLDYSTGYYNTADGETVVDCGDSLNM